MGSLSERAQEIKGRTGRLGLKILIWLKRKAKKDILTNLEGSGRDPLLYMGATSIVLFLLVSLISPAASLNQASLLVLEQNLQPDNPFVMAGTKVKESPELSLVQRNSLSAVSPPIMVTPQVLGALTEAADYEWTQKQITEYVVQPGDTLSSIAERFNISLNTILWANNLTKTTLIQIGQKLVILPTSGVVHHVQKGDTLSQIAKTYKSETDKIIAFNDLSAEGDIYIGDILIVPDGVTPPPVVYAPQQVPLASSYFICPIASPCRITQGLHWYNAIDFSHGKCGEPIYAAAAGTVLKVRLTSSTSKWAFGGAGNHLTILHPNGVVTMYGHLQTALVSPGEYVSQGQVIALMGGTPGTPGAGNSTGCHVHFQVSGAANPFAR
jgi:murein DD-endopeptidase MepM/ murein hydrolase activator NlpD